MRILVTDGMDKSALQSLKDKGHEVVEQFYAPEELGEALKGFDAVVVRSATKVRAAHIDAAKGGSLKLIIRGGVGVDNIDVKYAEEAGITVKNTPNKLFGSISYSALRVTSGNSRSTAAISRAQSISTAKSPLWFLK